MQRQRIWCAAGRVDTNALARVAAPQPPARTKTRALAPLRSESKTSKAHQLAAAMERDRAKLEAQQPFDLMKEVKTFPWKAFISFMMFWTWLGWYVIPLVKGFDMRTGEGPSREEQQEYMNEQRKRLQIWAKRKMMERQREQRARKSADVDRAASDRRDD